ncbi:hypothetical protein PENSPDRAFT_691438, partial [Peniophora sp. CONT]
TTATATIPSPKAPPSTTAAPSTIPSPTAPPSTKAARSTKAAPRAASRSSPRGQHRAFWKTFSVSDLTAPAWCEVQFDYGLRQGRWRELDQRAPSILTAHNKIIRVDMDIAAENDRAMKEGLAIHASLERHLRPDGIQVRCEDDNERWAWRILRIIACAKDIRDSGFCREMPVFGILHGKPVNGVMDEVERRSRNVYVHSGDSDSEVQASSTKRAGSLIPAARGTKRQRTATGAVQLATPRMSPEKAGHILHLSDTKTRRGSSLPSDQDASAARMQLMIYRKLLIDMISSSFSWRHWWATLNIDASMRLPDRFLEQALPHITSAGTDLESLPRNLSAMVHTLCRAFDDLDIAGVDRELEIVYLAQVQRSQASTSDRGMDVALTADISGVLLDTQDDTVHAIPVLPSVNNSVNDSDPSMQADHGAAAYTVSAPVSVTQGATYIKGWRVLGRTTFSADDNLLDDHLTRVLEWWGGERPPKGVSAGETHRCASGCEWRQETLEVADGMSW